MRQWDLNSSDAGGSRSNVKHAAWDWGRQIYEADKQKREDVLGSGMNNKGMEEDGSLFQRTTRNKKSSWFCYESRYAVLGAEPRIGKQARDGSTA